MPELPQFPDGGPPVFVRNTFLHIDVPKPIQLESSKSMPIGERRSMYEDDSSSDDDAGKRPQCPPMPATYDDVSSSDEDRAPDIQPTDADAPIMQQVCEPHAGRWGDRGAERRTMVPVPLASVPMMPRPMRGWEAMAIPMVPPAQSIMTSGGMMSGIQPGMLMQPGWARVPTIAVAPSGGHGGTAGPARAPVVPQVLPSPQLPTQHVALQEQPTPEAPTPQPQALSRAFSSNSDVYWIHWTVDARKLRGNDKQAVSPPFELWLGSRLPSVTFKMMIYPKQVDGGKGGASFKKAHGRGIVQLKCETELTNALTPMSFRIMIGSADKQSPPRGPVLHNFSKSAVSGLPKDLDEWDFNTVVNQEFMTFVVGLEIAPPH